MTTHALTLTLEAPLSVALSRQAAATGTVDHLPGSTLRGALAARWIAIHGDPDRVDKTARAEFARLFLDEDATRFRPLWPGRIALPRTAETCKREKGLEAAPGGRDRGGHGVFDTLLWHIAGRKKPQCPDCGAALAPVAGERRYVHRDAIAPLAPRYEEARVRRGQRTHVGIDRTLRTKAEAILYSEEALDPWRQLDPGDRHERVVLYGAVEADDSGLDALRRLLANAERPFFAGRSRTRGFGEGQLTLGERLPALDADGQVAGWYERGRRAAAEVMALARAGENEGAGVDKRWSPDRAILLALHFPAGAILVDDLLRGTNDPQAAISWLPRLPQDGDFASAAEAEVGGVMLACIHGDLELEVVRGWNAAHGLPKADDLALRPGSVIAYRARGDEAAVRSLLELLRADTEMGIGLRRNEGFGRVVVNDEIHLDLALGREGSGDGNARGRMP